MAVSTRSVVWVDAGGNVTITRINTQGGAGSIQTNILGIINADRFQYWEGTLSVNGFPTPSAAQYQPVSARATLVFTTTAPGVLVELTLIAPDIGIFLADQRTIDLTNTGVVSLITACVGVLCDTAGNTAVSCIAGFLN